MFATATRLIASCGYAVVAIGVVIESIGVPFPGEATLIGAALIAGASHRMSIAAVVLAAAVGAVFGGGIGLWIGRHFGFCVGITLKRINIRRHLLLSYAGNLVFVGRFLTYLRIVVAFFAGASRMTWSRFFVFNSLVAVA